MIKVKNLIILYPSFERGGATVNLINFINICALKNIKIYLITNIKKKDKKKFFKKNIKFINLDNKVNYKPMNRLTTSITSIFLLLNLFKKTDSKNSLVVSFQSHIFPIIFSKLFRRKIVIRNSEDIIEATKYANYKFFASFVFLLKLFFYNFSNGIITNSNKAKRSLDVITFKNKTKLIFNPYLKKIFSKKIVKRKNFILSVGRLCKQKNQTISIVAFSNFLKRFPNYKLVLIGHGEDELKLRKLCIKLNINKNVIFKGWLPNPKKYYLMSKILIFPSLYEGLPNTLIEAVNFNLPCISTKCSGATDILTEKYGTFTTRYDHALLTKKMIASILNYKKTLSNNQKIKKRLSRFLIKPQVSKYISYCNNVMNDFSK
jgi:glycosyltransferase involved in cell wall biosynthesis